MMHAGSITTSKVLQDTLSVLLDGNPHTPEEIRSVTNSQAVHSDVAALRASHNGFVIDYKRTGTTPAGRVLGTYTLITKTTQTRMAGI